MDTSTNVKLQATQLVPESQQEIDVAFMKDFNESILLTSFKLFFSVSIIFAGLMSVFVRIR